MRCKIKNLDFFSFFCFIIFTKIKQLSLSTQSINFGTIVIGESLNKKTQLINKGALGTKFKITTSQEFKKTLQIETNADRSKELNETVVEQDSEKYDEIKIGKVIAQF
jgi:hypothetical protein